MAGFALDISGIKGVEAAIKKIDSKATKGLSDELNAASLNIEKSAKRLAPGNLGKLRQSINHDTGNDLFKAVFSINTDNTQPNIKYEVVCDVQQLNFNVLRSSLTNIEVRRDLFNSGTETAVKFLYDLEDCVQELG